MTTPLQKLGLTPVKGALVGLLAIGMGWVWSPLILGEARPPRRESVARAPKKSPSPKPARLEKAQDPNPSPAHAVAAVKMTLAEATRHDPFATPAWAPQPGSPAASGLPASPGLTRERFKTLASTGVAMLLVSEEGQAAQIGDRTVQVGDVIDGFRVVEISPSGVRFVPDDEGGEHGA